MSCNLLPACSSTNMTAALWFCTSGSEGCGVLARMLQQGHRATIAFSFPETLAATARFGQFGPLVARGSVVIRRFLLLLGALVVVVDAGSFVFQGSESSTLTATAVVIALIAAFALSYGRGD